MNEGQADELIEALGGIDQILEDKEEAVREWFKNLNASNEQDARAMYAEDGP